MQFNGGWSAKEHSVRDTEEGENIYLVWVEEKGIEEKNLSHRLTTVHGQGGN